MEWVTISSMFNILNCEIIKVKQNRSSNMNGINLPCIKYYNWSNSFLKFSTFSTYIMCLFYLKIKVIAKEHLLNIPSHNISVYCSSTAVALLMCQIEHWCVVIILCPTFLCKTYLNIFYLRGKSCSYYFIIKYMSNAKMTSHLGNYMWITVTIYRCFLSLWFQTIDFRWKEFLFIFISCLK